MSRSDIVVGCVAVLLGLVALAGALRNEPAAYEPAPVRWIEARWGRLAARACYGLLGLAMIAMGCVIFSGFAFPWQR